MSAPLLAEGTVYLIRDYIRDNIKDALAVVNAARPDAAHAVGLEEPRSYFAFDYANTYKCPAVFVLCEDMDFQPETGPNFIYAKSRVILSVVVEDQREEDVTLKVYRYQSALFDLVNNKFILDPTQRLKLNLIVKRALYSQTYRRNNNEDETELVFRKEALFELDVVHQESF